MVRQSPAGIVLLLPAGCAAAPRCADAHGAHAPRLTVTAPAATAPTQSIILNPPRTARRPQSVFKDTPCERSSPERGLPRPFRGPARILENTSSTIPAHLYPARARGAQTGTGAGFSVALADHEA